MKGDSWKVKFLMGWDNYDIKNKEIDPDEDFFQLGMLMDHGLIDKEFHLTKEGQKEFERLANEKITENQKQ